jgi:hypothetical protein
MHGANGILFEPGDTVSLRESVEHCRDMSAKAFDSMSMAARVSTDPRCRETAVFGRLLDGYRSLLL